MFDVSFGELMVIGAVALVVIGPERLPKVARTVGSFIGKAQRYAAQVRDDINRQIELDELRKTQQEIQAAAQQFEQTIHQEIHKAETEVSQIQQELAQVRQEVEHIPAAPEPLQPAGNDSQSGDLFAPLVVPVALESATPDNVAADEQEFLSRQMDLFAEAPAPQPSSPKAG